MSYLQENENGNERKIRANGSTALVTPPVYDIALDADKPRYQNGLTRPEGFPRFLHRICDLDSPVYHPISREPGYARYLQILTGTALVIDENGKTTFVSAGSCIYLAEKFVCDLLLGRGEHNWLTAYWEPTGVFVPPVTEPLAIFHLDKSSESSKALTREIALRDGATDDVPHLLLAWINSQIHDRTTNNIPFKLTRSSGELEENLQLLLQTIVENPQTDWNLARAAQVAGYSPFHLSRIFRANLAVGLPKFVELCRTEAAIPLILHSNTPMHLISEQCGFGTPQAMRTAIREHTGFLPTELRGRGGE